MILNLLAALCVALALGCAVTWIACPRTQPRPASALLVVFVGLGSGLGISSVLLFLWLMATDGAGKAEPVWLTVLAIVLAVVAMHPRWRRHALQSSLPADTSRAPWLSICSGLAGVAAAAAFVLMCFHSPHGRWDAWSDWNRHARFMFRGGPHWRDVFSSAEAAWTATYPMLTPGAVAQGWFFANQESLLAPNAVAFLFAASAAGLLTSSLSLLRGRNQGLIAGLILLCSPGFVDQATTQYADIPLASFYLGAVLLLCLHDAIGNSPGWLVMAGLMTGLAAWTKPEGLVFTLTLVLVRCIVVGLGRGLKAWVAELLPFALGLLPVLALVLFFKFHMVGASSYFIQGQTQHTIIGRVLTGHRYLLIVKAFATQSMSWGGWGVTLLPMLLLYLLVVGINPNRRDWTSIGTSFLTITLMACAYFLVYVITPQDLPTQLDQSLDRVLMQLWPLTIFAFFLLARTPDEAIREGSSEIATGVQRRSPTESLG